MLEHIIAVYPEHPNQGDIREIRFTFLTKNEILVSVFDHNDRDDEGVPTVSGYFTLDALKELARHLQGF